MVEGHAASDVVLILIIGTLGMVILALGLIFFFVTYQKRLQKQQMDLMVMKSEHQRELLENTVHAQEKERKRFASDLHDEVGAMLSVIKMNLSRLEKKEENNTLKELASESKEHIDDVIAHVRRITRALSPPSLEKFGLVHSMNEFIEWVNKTNQVKIDFWLMGNEARFDPASEIASFRIFQELLNNSIKHSQASTIAVKLKFTAKCVFLSVSDNGIGFDVKKATSSGLGLKNLESRAEVMQGKFKINSSPGKGTTSILAFKLKLNGIS